MRKWILWISIFTVMNFKKMVFKEMEFVDKIYNGFDGNKFKRKKIKWILRKKTQMDFKEIDFKEMVIKEKNYNRF